MPKKSGHGPKPKRKQRIGRASTAAVTSLSGAAAASSTASRPAATFARPNASAIQSVPRPSARPSRSAAALPTDYGYVATDLRRIGVLAGAAVAVLGMLTIAHQLGVLR